MSTNHASDKKALFALLADGLTTASQTAWEAHHAAARGEDNEAIGTLLPVMEQLETFTALCRTILALHRIGKGGAA
jgi:hypothetical protein